MIYNIEMKNVTRIMLCTLLISFEYLLYDADTTLFCTYEKFEIIDDKNCETRENNIRYIDTHWH